MSLSRAFVRKLLKYYRLFKKLTSASPENYLYETGWLNSVKNDLPISKEGNSLPRYTYPIIQFLEERLEPNMDVFEFGAGISTLYYSSRVNSVVSVEHDSEWFDRLVRLSLPKNVNLIYQELENGEYCHMANEVGQKFDIIAVDGRDRVNCIRNAVDALKDDGVIIVDNAHRKEYKEGFDFLQNRGFKKIAFVGLSSLITWAGNTTIFYRQKNCLNI